MTSVNAGCGFVLFAKDVRRVAAFYQQVLGMSVIEDENTHIVLSLEGLEIVVHAIPKKIASSIEISDPPAQRSGSPYKPAFFVEDLASVRSTMKSVGGGLKPMSGAWNIRGAVVLDGWDPEGNIVQFKQKT